VKLLLDTHVLLWSLLAQKQLSPVAVNALADDANEVLISVVSAWEIEIKAAKGKLPLPVTMEEALSKQRFKVLPVTLRHVLAVELLPAQHRDPFDRMLIAQAQTEGLTLVTSDRLMQRYPVATLSAI
jgi:PIN domain nuclease of toxin-antitoxin system